MTVSTTTNKKSYTGNGSTTVFAYDFRILSNSDLQVYVDETLKTLDTHYTVSGAGDASGGSVTFTGGNTPPDTKKVVIIRNMPQTQATDYVANDPFPAETHEEALDKLTMIAQDVQKDVDESFRFASTVTDAGTITIDKNASDRASLVLAFDSSGNLAATQELGEHKGNWAASTAYVLRDIVKDTNNNNQYICIVAHTSSGSVPISTNTDAAKWRLLVDAASATTAKTGAETAQAASEAARDLALSYRNTAETHKNSAATSASNASTSESNASSSASSASSSASSSSSSSTTSSNYAVKVDGAVTGTDYSSKAWAVGGTGVTDTASRGAAKEWATAAEDDQVDGSEYSAKHYATKAAASATSAASSAAGMEAATIKNGTYWGYTTAGSANTYTLTTSPTISSYAADMFYHIKMNASNTGASTINVDSVGAKNIKKYGGAGMVDLAANDLESGGVYTIIYDGTQFLLLGGSATDSQVDINTADIFMLNSRRLSDHSANVLNTVDGFVDDFQDGSTQNNTAIDISGSSNISHDNSSKYWQNARGSAVEQEQTTQNSSIIVGTTSSYKVAQIFQAASTYSLNQVQCYMYRNNTSSTDNVYLTIHATSASGSDYVPTGSALATSANVGGSTIPSGSDTWVSFTFSSPPTLTSGTSYAIVMHRSGSADDSNFYRWDSNNSSVDNMNVADALSSSEDYTDANDWAVGTAGSTCFKAAGTGANLQGTFKTRVFGGTNMPPVPASSPSNIVVEIIDKQITGTPTYKISRDGGSNFQTISSWQIEDTLADSTVVRLADVTMTATAGTSPLLQIEQSGTGQDYRIYSVGLKYK